MSEEFYRKEVERLTQTSKDLEINVALVARTAKDNEKLLKKVDEKIDMLTGKIHNLEDTIVTKNNLEVAVNTTLNKHAAKVFWAILTVAVGSVLTWIGSILK